MNRMVGVALVLGLVSGATVAAQLRGMGRLQGTVADDSGAPLPEVTIKAALAGFGGTVDGSSDAKGQWILGGLARGEWEVTFEKAGYAPRKATVSLQVELAKVPPIAVVMKKQ
jgi:hypothetical protein